MRDIVAMSKKELHRVEMIQRMIDRRLYEKDVAYQLGLSVRQVRRLKKQYLADGAKGLISKKRGKPSNHKYSESFKDLTLSYIREYYHDFKPTFACEKLRMNHAIFLSVETLRKWMIEAEIWIPRAHRLKRAYQPRNRRECYGELIQIDGSPHDWFEGRAKKCTLLVFIDDATGRLMECQFVQSESTFTYFDSTKRYLKNHGKPVAFYSDKHSIFRTNKSSGAGLTQYGRALDDLNIDIICANTPQAKGRVERANRTLQDRLIKEMRLVGISSMEEGNKYLPKFMDEFNNKFEKEAINPKNIHRELVAYEDLNEIFSWQEERTLSLNLTIQYDKVLYMIKDSVSTRKIAHHKLTVFDYHDGSIKIKHKNKELPFKIFDKLQRVDQGQIVENKRLGSVLIYVKKKQEMREDKRSQSMPSRQHLGETSTTKIRKKKSKSMELDIGK